VTTDPFDRLRAPDAPALPPERFVNRLRHQLVAALSAELPTISLPERTPTMTTNETTATAPTASTPAATTTGPANVLVPYLSVTNAAEAISWYVEVLGARELLRYDADDGRVVSRTRFPQPDDDRWSGRGAEPQGRRRRRRVRGGAGARRPQPTRSPG
jgi:hypothetical protein